MKVISVGLIVFVRDVSALTSHRSDLKVTAKLQSMTETKTILKTVINDESKRKNRCKICPDPEENPELDRREAMFSLLGQVSAGMSTLLWAPKESEATYGADAKLEIPNVMDGISNRASGRQCLVESLGNRECLAYLDPEKKLWQNPDSEILINRLQKAITAFAEVPVYVRERKWSKISGTLTGPMGSLSDTMNMLSKMSDDSPELKRQSKIIKTTLYEINSALEQKDSDKILNLHNKATSELSRFIQNLS